MRRIEYRKREIVNGSYLITNSIEDPDPDPPTHEENICSPGFKITINYPDIKILLDLFEFSTCASPVAIEECKAVLRGEPSEWKVSALQLSAGQIEVFFASEKAFIHEKSKFDGDVNNYTTSADLSGSGAYNVSFSLELPNSNSTIKKYKVRVGHGFTEVTEFEKDRESFFLIKSELNTESAEPRTFISETERIY